MITERAELLAMAVTTAIHNEMPVEEGASLEQVEDMLEDALCGGLLGVISAMNTWIPLHPDNRHVAEIAEGIRERAITVMKRCLAKNRLETFH